MMHKLEINLRLDFSFYSNDIERLRFRNNGSIGIGVQYPSHKLEIYSDVNVGIGGVYVDIGCPNPTHIFTINDL